jgi:hypothetical protein
MRIAITTFRDGKDFVLTLRESTLGAHTALNRTFVWFLLRSATRVMCSRKGRG